MKFPKYFRIFWDKRFCKFYWTINNSQSGQKWLQNQYSCRVGRRISKILQFLNFYFRCLVLHILSFVCVILNKEYISKSEISTALAISSAFGLGLGDAGIVILIYIEIAKLWPNKASTAFALMKGSIHKLQSMTSNCHTFLQFLGKKCDNLRTFTQTILFLDYNKTKKAKTVTIWRVTIWGHGIFVPFVALKIFLIEHPS